MATRLRLSSYSNSSPGSFAPDASWESTGAWIASRATPGRLNSPTPGNSVSASKSVATNPSDVIEGQFTTPSLDGAQTISGTLTVTVKALESATTNDDFLQVVARVIDERGFTARGTLFSGQTQTVVSATPSDPNGEFGTSASVRTLTVNLSPVACLDRDRIIVEIGYRSPTATTGHTATLTFGDNAGVDLPATAGDTSSADAWIEFSQDISFVPVIAPVTRKLISLGDSLLAGFSSNMAADMATLGFNNPQIDALAGRFTYQPGSAAFRSYALINYFRAFNPPYEPEVWVIQLGTNDVLSQSSANHQSNIDALLRTIDEASGQKHIYWVDLCGDVSTGVGTPPGATGGTLAAYNDKLNATAQARSDMTVIPWAAYAVKNGDATWWDGADANHVHMTAAGYEAKRQFLKSWIADAYPGVQMPGLKATTLSPSTTRSSAATFTSGAFAYTPDRDMIYIHTFVSAISGTSPTLTVSVEWSHDGVNFVPADPADSMTAITAVGGLVEGYTVKAPFFRIKEVVAGTSPSVTRVISAAWN